MLPKLMYRLEERLSFNDPADGIGPADQRRHHRNQRREMPLKGTSMLKISVQGVLLMVCFTASLLVLPLVLPPLPPPPLFLLLVPIAIMAVLVFLAVTPPELPRVASNSV